MAELDPDIDALMRDPATHGLSSGERVDVIETHGAKVFLAGDRVYKIKKPVDFPYMDFSSFDKREAACEREMELNRPAAPSLYLGLSRITRAAGGALALDGEGEPVETAVRMRRFDQDQLLSAMADEGRVGPDLAGALAAMARASHAAAPTRPRVDFADRAVSVLEGGAEQFAQAADIFEPEAAAAAVALLRGRLQAVRPVLQARAARGLVRRCHGDLHLGNIVMLDGEPAAFDALEFDEALAEIDVGYDLAFLMMDLAWRGLTETANAVLNAYLDGAAPVEADLLAVLAPLAALRAQVRAKVAADRASELAPGEAFDGKAEEARALLGFSEQLLCAPPARLVALGGLSGTGKSTLARRLAPGLGGAFGALVVRSDVERKALLGHGPTERLPESAYGSDMNAAVHERLLEKARAGLDAGAAVIVDTVNARESERRAFQALANQTGARFDGLWLEAGAEDLEARVEARVGDASDATAEVVRRQLDYDVGDLTGFTRIRADGAAQETLEAARAALVEHGGGA